MLPIFTNDSEIKRIENELNLEKKNFEIEEMVLYFCSEIEYSLYLDDVQNFFQL